MITYSLLNFWLGKAASTELHVQAPEFEAPLAPKLSCVTLAVTPLPGVLLPPVENEDSRAITGVGGKKNEL